LSVGLAGTGLLLYVSSIDRALLSAHVVDHGPERLATLRG
jgi:hypothetical protein